MFLHFPEPPTNETRREAQLVLQNSRDGVQDLSNKIDGAERTLAQIVRDSRRKINELESQKALLERHVELTLAYLSPIRRLPLELLREIFLFVFDTQPCCGWTLASVCRPWRNLSLQTPRIWSRIRLLTTQHASPDVIRLWLERSGSKEPLDIEIFLQVSDTNLGCEGEPRNRRRMSSVSFSSTPGLSAWGGPFPVPVIHSHYIIPPGGNTSGPQTITILPAAGSPISLPPTPSGHTDSSQSASLTPEQMAAAQSRSMSWGYIAFYYLVDQMHRWRRFVFRFDKQFNSIGALKSIMGDAPLLEEFDVSCFDPTFYSDWSWLPNAPSSVASSLPRLKHLTLQHTPFRTTSAVFHNLHTLNVRPPPAVHYSLDRIMYLISRNLHLKELSLQFHSAQQAVLPLNPTVLPDLEKFSVGGHYLMIQLVDMLSLPSLKALEIDIENRDPIEESITNLMVRSGRPHLEQLSIAYGNASSSSSYFYGPGGLIISWPAFLVEFPHLKTLQIGATSIEHMWTTLGVPDEDMNPIPSWVLPKLETLSMRNCHIHVEGISRLVHLVENRNPKVNVGATSVNGVVPVPLKKLELYECTNVSEDVVEWLGERIDQVIFTDALDNESPRSPYLS